ncbi:hypothetical protein ASD99_17340 [Mesorhizobium sp. Root695]|jgi:hypothetical protein|nr:hypothetical protein ASD12_10440 [Mesorhizobium sp. Root102]KRB33574.1 hypothetical protein ASD99_17340 [Mesorhizobium sp. Root695]
MGMAVFLELMCHAKLASGRWFRNIRLAVSCGGATTGRFLRRNQMARRALLGMDSRKPYQTPQWWPGRGYEDREAMCCSFCGGRDHRYEDCPQQDPAANPPSDALDRVSSKPN